MCEKAVVVNMAYPVTDVVQDGGSLANEESKEDFSKADEAAIGFAEEHKMSMRDVLRHNKIIVWWCFFFSFSAIGW